MDRNQIIGFILIFVIIVAWGIVQKPPAVQDIDTIETPMVDSLDADPGHIPTLPSDTTAPAPNEFFQKQFGDFARHATGTEQDFILENDLVRLTFSNKGGRLIEAVLKKHFQALGRGNKGKEREEIVLFEDDKNTFGYRLNLGGVPVNTQDLYFESSRTNNQLEFKITTGDGGFFVQRYALKPDSYRVDYDIRIYGLNQLIDKGPIPLEINNYLTAIEENVQFEKRYSTVYYKEQDEDSDYCSCTSTDQDDRSSLNIEWVAFANQFFNTSIVTKGIPFDGMVAGNEMMPEKDVDLKRSYAYVGIPYKNGLDERFGMEMYVGPNEYKRLRAFDNDLQEIIPFGRSIFGDINRLFIRPFFDWLSQYIGSKGVVIIVLIFLVKMAFYPLTYKMLHSQAKMGALKPELAKLKERYKDDMQQQQVETMKIYREYGVSPFGGCLPMIVQMPIWYALFRFFPASITFRQEPFLWAHDLSSYDVLFYLPFEIPMMGGHLSLFTILWAVTTVIYTFYNMRHMDMSANPAMKYVQYMMPLMFFVFFNNYASGLTCYMFFSNLINIGQTIVTKKFVFDDDKIRAQLNEQKSKPKKKNSFQARLEEAMKQQQKIQQQKATQRTKKVKKK